MERGDIWWAHLPDPTGAGPGYRRPVLLIQANAFTNSRIATIIVVVLTSNLQLAMAPGNVLIRAQESGLAKDSIANVSQIVTLDKNLLDDYIGHIQPQTLSLLNRGLRIVLEL